MIARLLFRLTAAVLLALLFAAFELAAAPADALLMWAGPTQVPTPATTLSLRVH